MKEWIVRWTEIHSGIVEAETAEEAEKHVRSWTRQDTLDDVTASVEEYE